MNVDDLVIGQKFLFAISAKNHKVIKFIDSNSRIRVVKVISIDDSPYTIALYLNRVRQIKQYLLRLYQLTWEAELPHYFQVQTKQYPNQNFVIKMKVKYYQIPTLSDFYQFPHFRQKHKVLNTGSYLIYYFQQFFMHILKGEGIDNYIYSPQNFFIYPPTDVLGMTMSGLSLNISSTSGLKFITKISPILRSQFIEIYPCLPPNTKTLLNKKNYIELNKLIRIRSFAFNMLCFILKRIPYLLDQNIKALINPDQDYAYTLIQQSPKIFQQLLKLQKKALKKAKNLTNIQLTNLFQRVFVKCDISLYEVYQIVFKNRISLKQIFLQKDFSKQVKEKQQKQKKYFDNLGELLWNRQTTRVKQRYRELGLVENQDKYLYLLVKNNCDFHLFLRHSNLFYFFKEQRLTLEGQKMVIFLMKLLNEESNSSSLENNASRLLNYIKEKSLDSSQQKNSQMEGQFIQQKPEQIKEYKNMQKGVPLSLFQNVLTYDNKKEAQKQGEQKVEPKKRIIQTMEYKLQTLHQYSNQLWLV